MEPPNIVNNKHHLGAVLKCNNHLLRDLNNNVDESSFIIGDSMSIEEAKELAKQYHTQEECEFYQYKL